MPPRHRTTAPQLCHQSDKNLLQSRRVSQTYSQPTVLWRVVRGANVGKAVFVPHTVKSTLVVFKNETIYHIEDVEDWNIALERSMSTRQTLINEGWREDD